MNSTNDQIKHSTATDGKPPVSCRFYRGYTIRNHGYYPLINACGGRLLMMKLEKLIFTQKG